MSDNRANDILAILRRHLIPHCLAANGDLPSPDMLAYHISKGGFVELTVDYLGRRDWKIDERPFQVRYRGVDPEAVAAARACNEELRAEGFQP